jgi:deoxyribodipyrimidine photo-lyase
MTNRTLLWFRRDLRLFDQAALFYALKERTDVLPIFIFDTDILSHLDDRSDARVTFIYDQVAEMKAALQKRKSDLVIRHGNPLEVLKKLTEDFFKNHVQITAIYTNHDYEPEARKRDDGVAKWAASQSIEFKTYKDQTLFEKEEILTDARKPYTVYTPYKRKVLANLEGFYLKSYPVDLYESSYAKIKSPEVMISLKDIGFERTTIELPDSQLSRATLKKYAERRDFPAIHKGTTHLGLHLRFGTVSVRELAREGKKHSEVWLSELIWRDFFMQILWHYPHVQKQSFRPEYDNIKWRNSKKDFAAWCEGRTGYPLVDAGMRELNATGFMHNRVRMVTASFLCKHLLIHWYEGERYFAKKLLDYDLAANNGNWQWAAGSGCDAAPYFRIFNPTTQMERFDPDHKYIKKWLPEFGTTAYPRTIVNHEEARGRCLQAFTLALKK